MRRSLHMAGLVLTAVLVFHGADALLRPREHGNRPIPFDRAAEADKYFYQQRLYPHGRVPGDWRERTREHIARMAGGGMAKQTASWNWISMGPNNIAGRVRAMAMDPTNPKVLYAGAAGGGVWKTTNGGTTWRPLSDFMPNLRIGSIAVHPSNPGIVLAGNGEGFVQWQGELAYGRGIYRSDNGGDTWTLLPSTDAPNFEFVFDIGFSPFQPDVILASTRRGIIRSSDGGQTWTRVLAGTRGMMTAFSRTTPGLVYAAMEGLGVFRSTDHGTTWSTVLKNGIPVQSFSRIQLAVAPSNGDIMYAAFTADNESCAGVFRTSDRGDTWKTLRIPTDEIDGETYMGEQGQYNSVLTVHPVNPDIVWAGGIDLYRTTDAGTSWKQMTNWYPYAQFTYVHADQHAFLFNPQNPNEVFAACDGGVFRSGNGGASFLELSNGFVNVQFHSGTPHPTTDVVLGGTIDNGTLKVSTGSQWNMVEGGDGGYTAIDYNDPRTMYTELYYLWFYKSTGFGAAGTFSLRMNGIPRAPGGWTSDRVAFIAPFEMDPNNPRVLYAGTYRLYRTTNGADLWTPFSPDLSGNFTGYITAIGLSKSNSAVLYTGSSVGAVYVTTNNGTNWTRVNTGLPQRYITDLAVDRDDPGTAYVTFSGFGGGHIFQTTNYGASWSDISGTSPMSLPDVPANTVVIHPVQFRKIYVGTDVGVFHTSDGGQSWALNNSGMGNVTVADLQFRKDGTLFAATHGRGMFRTDYSLLDSQRAPVAGTFRLEQNYPNPLSPSSDNSTTIAWELMSSANITLEVHDASGRRIRQEELGLQTPGRYRHHFNGAGLGTGAYFYRLIVNGRESQTRRMLLVK